MKQQNIILKINNFTIMKLAEKINDRKFLTEVSGHTKALMENFFYKIFN